MTAGAKPAWPIVRRVVTWLFFALAATLLVTQARKLDWNAIGATVAAYNAGTVLNAALFAVLTYTIYSCFDVLGRSYSGVRAHAGSFMGIAFVSYACNQNLGALIGTVGLRLRLYSRLGLSLPSISRIIMLSVATNWLGYLALAGVLLAGRLIRLPAGWGVGLQMLQAIGILLLCAVLVYLWLCAFARHRHIKVYRTRFDLPSFRIAIGQLLLSMTHWPATAAIIYVLLNGKVDFVSVLAAYMLTSVAVVVTHLPAGVGVLEGMFIVLLGKRLPHTELLAALLAFRAFFHVGALCVAGLIYLALEARLTAAPGPGSLQPTGQVSRSGDLPR